MRARDGFTLLELLAVLTILAVLSALVLPRFGLDRESAGQEASRLASTLRYITETAAARRATVALEIDLGTGGMSWSSPSDEALSGSLRLKTLRALRLESKGYRTEGQFTVFFYPTGMREFMWLYLRERDAPEGDALTVTYNPVSGRVKTIEGAPEGQGS